jgi:hypothetical protein
MNPKHTISLPLARATVENRPPITAGIGIPIVDQVHEIRARQLEICEEERRGVVITSADAMAVERARATSHRDERTIQSKTQEVTELNPAARTSPPEEAFIRSLDDPRFQRWLYRRKLAKTDDRALRLARIVAMMR